MEPFTESGILTIARSKNREVITNCPKLLVHHSPTGFEFGYGGSGPADLALNIIEAVLLNTKYHGERMRVFDGSCFEKSYDLHQDFKWKFIAKIPYNGGQIAYDTIVKWINERL